MPRRKFLILILWSGLWAAELQPATVPHVIHISMDGLRGDLLQNLVGASPWLYPNYYRLQTEGAFTYNARCDFACSVTVPNHITMVTGRPIAQPAGLPPTVHHGYTRNFPEPGDTIHNAGNTNLDYVPSVFDVVHDHGLTTGLFLGKSRLDIIARSYDPTQGAPDLIGEDNGPGKVDHPLVLNGGSAQLVQVVCDILDGGSLNYIFLHIVDPDSSGHSSGWGSAAWNQTIQTTDEYLGRIFETIDSNPSLAGRIAIILSADHGGGGEGIYYHGDPSFPENYTIPFFVWGAGIPGGFDLHDLMPNRYPPGQSRPDYTHPRQPIRNGDGPNLALLLLGLEPIPGSFMRPALSFEPPLKLAWHRDENGLVLRWAASEPGVILEGTRDMTIGDWEAITEGIQSDGVHKWVAVDPADTQAKRYHRLRRD